MLKPCNDFVLIKRVAPAQASAGGIVFVLASDAKQEPAVGTIVAAGPGRRDKRGQLVPMEVKVGERVLIGHYGGTSVKIDGEELVMVREGDLRRDEGILAVIEEPI